MSKDDKLANLYFYDFVKNYEGTLKIDPQLDLSKFNSISTDTRTIKKGDIFVALNGENFKGGNFTGHAIQKGANFFITDTKTQIENGIVVKSSNKFLEDFASFIIQKSKNLKVFGITGTNGKTTTKELLTSILSKKFAVLSNKGNLNTLIGLPMTIINLEQAHRVLVVEMGTNSKGEIVKLAEISKPNFATITNIGKGHTEKLINEKTIFEEKKNITNFFNQSCVFAFNFDNHFLKDFFSKIDCNKITFAIKEKADVFARNISDDFSKFDLCFSNQVVNIKLRAPGINNIYNSLCSSSLAIKAGVDLNLIKRGIEEFNGINNRFKIINLKNNNVIINDTYNANPNSMSSAIEMTNRIFSEKKKIAVLGDMLELGKISKNEHTKIGQELSSKGFNEVYAFGPNSKNYLKGLNKEIKFFEITSHSNIKRHINLNSLTNTVILVKGSRGMRMEKIFDSLDI